MTMEFIFAVVTAVVTALIGVITKNNVVPARLVPIQNLIIGVVAAVVAIYFHLFDDVGLALLVSLGMSLGVGGTYDLVNTNIKEKTTYKK